VPTPHLSIVTDAAPEESGSPTFLWEPSDQPPVAWFGLLAATFIDGVARRVRSTLFGVEVDDDWDWLNEP
jgi:hypothetical protein